MSHVRRDRGTNHGNPAPPPIHDMTLEAENARLRARVEELEHILYPPPPPPKEPDDPNRYLLVPKELQEHPDNGWWRLQRGWMLDALHYLRERYPDLHWHYAYGWENVPEHGQYVPGGDAWRAMHRDEPVVLYKIDDRRCALDAISMGEHSQRKRLHDVEHEVMFDQRPGAEAPIREFRIWWHRWHHILGNASRRLNGLFSIACNPLSTADYAGLVQAATATVDHAIAAAQADIAIEDLPGYLPDGWWECRSCGYPFPDSEKNTDECDACDVADPTSHEYHAKLVEDMRAEGSDEIADKLEHRWRSTIEHATLDLEFPPNSLGCVESSTYGPLVR